MSLLDAGTIADLRTLNEDAMPDTCQIVVITEATNAIGELVKTEAIGQPVACRYRPAGDLRPQEREKRAAWMSDGTGILSLPYGTLVTTHDQIIFQSTQYPIAGIKPQTGHSSSVVICVKGL